MKDLPQNKWLVLYKNLTDFVSRADKQMAEIDATYARALEEVKRRYANDLANMENTFKAKCAANEEVEGAFRFFEVVLDHIEQLERDLQRNDTGYKAVKKLLAPHVAGVTDQDLMRECRDLASYRDVLNAILSQYRQLSIAYCGDAVLQQAKGPMRDLKALPLLNKLTPFSTLKNAFSFQQYEKYMELFVLQNTAEAIVEQAKKMAPQRMTEADRQSATANFAAHRHAAMQQQEGEKFALEKKYTDLQQQTKARLRAELDQIFPEACVSYHDKTNASYHSAFYQVNSGRTIQNNVLYRFFMDFRVPERIQDIFTSRCFGVADFRGNPLPFRRLAVFVSTSDIPAWRVDGNGFDGSRAQEFVCSIMFGLLSACPVGTLTYTIVDPEKRGNRIPLFAEAIQSLPALFDGEILAAKEEVAAKIGRLRKKIDYMLQNKLREYKTVFDYAKDHPDYEPQVDLVVLFDFPRGFDERTLAELGNVLRNGSRCGIYTIIVYRADPKASGQYQQNLKSVLDLSVPITEGLTQDGLPSNHTPAHKVNEKSFAAFFSQYRLIYEGRKNRSVAFPPFIRGLLINGGSAELDAHMKQIGDMKRKYEEDYARVPEISTAFPSEIFLGNIRYPREMFYGSSGQEILERFGTENQSCAELPFTADLHKPFNLFLTGPKDSSMLRFTHHVIWSFLSYLPVTTVNVCVFDSAQRGNSVMPFLSFRKRSPDTFDQKIYTSQEEMTERLRKIIDQIDGTIQEKLRDQFQDILEYNQNTPNRTETLTLLVLYDLPVGLDGRGIDLLLDILRNGNRCGVFTVICHDPKVPLSEHRYEDMEKRLEQLTKYCTCVTCDDRGYTLLPSNLQIHIPPCPSDSTVDQFTNDYVAKCEEIRKRGFSFDGILSSPRFSLDSAQSLDIPVGVGDGDSIVRLTIGKGSSHHGLIAGATGSGKSTLLHTLIMSAMLNYSPDQLHLYLMDFKSGTEFKIYESVPMPHIQLLALDAMQEFGESILEDLVAEMERRGALFKQAGQTSLAGYIRAAGQPLPRILVIMDEFQILFNDSSNRKIAMNCDELTKRIVTEGRAFGIHLLMATQSTKAISELRLSSGTIEQMRIRVGLKCGEYDARYLFSDENDAKALTMMKGPVGTAVMNLDYTEQKNIGFRVAYCDEATQRSYLDLISKQFAGMPVATRIFEGGRTTRLLDYFAQNQIGITDALPVQLHIGELIKVAPPLVIAADKRRCHNLLVCGTNGKMAKIITQNYILSALLNRNTRVYYISGSTLVDDDPSDPFCEALSQWTGRFQQAQNRGDIFRFINEVYELYQDRKKQNSKEIIFVLFRDLQFLDVVCSMLKQEPIDESDYLEMLPEEPPAFDPADPFAAVNSMFANQDRSTEHLSTGEKLIRLMKNSYAFGIHFAVTALEYQTVRECMTYGENILSKFPERIIFDLNPRDAASLVEDVADHGPARKYRIFHGWCQKRFPGQAVPVSGGGGAPAVPTKSWQP